MTSGASHVTLGIGEAHARLLVEVFVPPGAFYLSWIILAYFGAVFGAFKFLSRRWQSKLDRYAGACFWVDTHCSDAYEVTNALALLQINRKVSGRTVFDCKIALRRRSAIEKTVILFLTDTAAFFSGVELLAKRA